MTTRTVNAAVKAAGYAERLVRHDGPGGRYYYWTDGDAARFYSASVYTSDVAALTVEQWIADLKRRRDALDAREGR